MMLSAHFSLEELTASEVAARAGIDNTPSAEVVRNLARLAEGLELVRRALGNKPVHITSGYRSARLNQMVGGSKNSMHIQGLAADILCAPFGPPLEVCRAIARSGIATDQIIHELGKWTHVAFPRPGQIGRNDCSPSGAPLLARNWDCTMYESRRAKKFGVTADQLRDAVKKVGPSAEAVERELKH